MSEQIASADHFLPSRSRFEQLPRELLIRISLLLDQPSAVALALTARAFNLPAVERIWSELDLSLPEHFGLPPCQQLAIGSSELSATPSSASSPIVDHDEERANAIYVAGMKEKIRSLLAADGRRLALVEKVRLVARRGISFELFWVLAGVSNTITALEFGSAPGRFQHWRNAAVWEPGEPQGLQGWMLRTELSFSSLTHIRIQRWSIDHAGFIPLLCNQSPKLEELVVEVDHAESWAKQAHPPNGYPDFARMTNIRRLRLAIGPFDDCYQLWYWSSPVFVSLLEHTPLLQRLSIELNLQFHCPNPPVCEFLFEFLGPVGQFRSLRDLRWPGADGYFQTYMRDDIATRLLPASRRLVLTPDFRSTISKEWPTEIDPEVLYLDAPPHDAFLYATGHTEKSTFSSHSTPRLRASLASQLRQSSQLRLIHFGMDDVDGEDDFFTRLDELEAEGAVAFTISSYRHGEQELLHVLLCSHWREIRCIEPVEQLEGDYKGRIIASAGDEADEASEPGNLKYYEWHSEPVVRHLTDLDGLVVPVEVIEQMRVAAGATEMQWDARGVHVGEAGWRVLADWEETHRAERALELAQDDSKVEEMI